MCSNLSRALFLVSALVLCGCMAQRAPKSPVAYRPRADPPPRAAAERRAPAPAAKPQSNPARRPARIRREASRPAGSQSVVYRREASRPAGAQSVVYRGEGARPQAKTVLREQPSGESLGKKRVDESVKPRQKPAPAVPPEKPQAVRTEPQRKGSPAENAKLKALYDSGFITREEFLRAGGGK